MNTLPPEPSVAPTARELPRAFLFETRGGVEVADTLRSSERDSQGAGANGDLGQAGVAPGPRETISDLPVTVPSSAGNETTGGRGLLPVVSPSSGDMPPIPDFLKRNKNSTTLRVAASSEIQAAPSSSHVSA